MARVIMAAMMTDSQPTTAEKPPDNPTRARRALLLTALLTIFQASAAVRALQTPDAVASISSIPPAFMVMASIFWAVVAAVVFALLWARHARGRQFAAGLVVGFSIYSLLRLLLFSQADYDRGRLPFLIVVTVGVVIVPVVYWLRQRRTLY